jgi:hypothetical protein
VARLRLLKVKIAPLEWRAPSYDAFRKSGT